jgi:hypothetical protein
MFTVKWVVRGREAEPLESEGFTIGNVDTLIVACRYRMAMMRLKHPNPPPDGFIVIDPTGKEIGRWFGEAAMP